MATITDAEWNELSPSNFETAALLRAMDAVDEMRGDLNDGEDGRSPQLRTDLLKLHRLAMDIINGGARSQVAELFEFAAELEDQVNHLMNSLEQVQDNPVPVDGALSRKPVLRRARRRGGGLMDDRNGGW